MSEETFTTFQVAKICGVRPTTIIKWVNQKKIKAYITLGGHRRILKSNLIEFLKENNFPIPKELFSARKKILIVEDEEAVGKLIQMALQNRLGGGVEVQWTQSGIEALLALNKTQPDLIVLDILIPGVDGASVMATLRSDPETSHIKVVGITGEKFDLEKIEFVKARADAFFYKPFDVQEFVQKIASILGLSTAESKAPSLEHKSL